MSQTIDYELDTMRFALWIQIGASSFNFIFQCVTSIISLFIWLWHVEYFLHSFIAVFFVVVVFNENMFYLQLYSYRTDVKFYPHKFTLLVFMFMCLTFQVNSYECPGSKS